MPPPPQSQIVSPVERQAALRSVQPGVERKMLADVVVVVVAVCVVVQR